MANDRFNRNISLLEYTIRCVLWILVLLYGYRFLPKAVFFCILVAAMADLCLSLYLSWRRRTARNEIQQAIQELENRSVSPDIEYTKDTNQPSMNVDYLISLVQKVLKSNYDSQILRSQAEIHTLQSQINPHFLYNTLETIRSQAIIQGSESIEKMTEALAVLFRYSISQPGEMATLRDELNNIDNYLLIQSYRFPDKFKVYKTIEDESLLDCKIPVLTLQPLVENAIHHGLELKMGTGIVRIRVFCTQTHLYVVLSDDGVGMDEKRLAKINSALENDEDSIPSETESARKHSGIALLNVNRRIQFYFGKEYGLHLYSHPNVGTTVELSLPNRISNHSEG